jgi:hypothetical protein
VRVAIPTMLQAWTCRVCRVASQVRGLNEQKNNYRQKVPYGMCVQITVNLNDDEVHRPRR